MIAIIIGMLLSKAIDNQGDTKGWCESENDALKNEIIWQKSQKYCLIALIVVFLIIMCMK